MKQASNRAKALIKELQAVPLQDGGWFRRTQPAAVRRAVELIGEITATGEWAAIVFLAPFLVVPDKEIARAAAAGVEALLSIMRPSLLLQLDDRLRGGLWTMPPYLRLWDAMQPALLSRPDCPADSFALISMASFHRNGHVRQAALERLSALADGRELPFLLIRLSDWVPQVSAIAARQVEKRINSCYLGHFVNNLAVLNSVKQRQRGANAAGRFELIESVTSLLKQPANRKCLLEGLQHSDLAVRRASLELLTESTCGDLPEIICRIMRDRDVTNRRASIKLLESLPPAEQPPLLERLAKDRAPGLRRDALNALSLVDSAGARTRLKAALLDRSAVVREHARWKLARFGANIDFRDFYALHMQSAANDSERAAAVSGLGETGKKDDAALLAPLLVPGASAVTKAAIRALARLDAAGYVVRFLELLQSDSPGVSCAAASALSKTMNTVSTDALMDAMSGASHWHVRRQVLRLLNEACKWERIICLLRAASHDDARVRELAIRYICSWQEKYRSTWQYTLPDERQKKQLAAAVRVVENTLPRPLESMLQQCLAACH